MLENLGVKLVCLLVAVVLWVQVAARADVEETVEIPVEFVDLPDTLVVRGATVPRQVHARIRASKLQLLMEDLLPGPRGRLLVSLASARPGAYPQPLSPQDVRINAEPLEVHPPVLLDLQIYRRLTRQLPVRADIEGQPPEGFAVAQAPRVTPAEVEVTGPEPLVLALDHVSTEPIPLTRRRRSFRETRKLASPDPDLQLRPVEVEVAVGIDAIVERTFSNLPLSVLSDLDSSHVYVRPTAAKVRLRGPAAAVEALGPEDVSVVLPIGDRPPGVYQLEGEVVVPDGIRTVTLDPPDFQVIVEAPGDDGSKEGP